MNRKQSSSFLLLLSLTLALPVSAKLQRSTAERHAFVKEAACPATGRHRLPCPGYIIDHVIPLCAGGPDKTSNMQWQTVAEAKAKDRLEHQQCRSLRKSH